MCAAKTDLGQCIEDLERAKIQLRTVMESTILKFRSDPAIYHRLATHEEYALIAINEFRALAELSQLTEDKP